MTTANDAPARPVLVVLTVAFHPGERAAASSLGLDLYDNLTRPVQDPLAFGASIPILSAVDPDHVNLDCAETVAVIPVLGRFSFALNRDATIRRIRRWHELLGPGHVLPVPVDEVWRNAEAELPGKLVLTELYGTQPRRASTLLEIVLAVSRLLSRDRRETTLFVSHAKSDLVPTQQAAEKIAHYAKTNATANAFFDTTELLSGESLQEQIDFAASRGVFVAVRGDSYSSRIWCQRELLAAKKHGLPTLTVELLQKGERRSLPYGGNSPTVVWNQGHDPAGQVVLQAMIEWLRSVHFLREAVRVCEAAGLPEADILIRPPELLDMAQGPLRSASPQLVMHPDPELSTQERQVLMAANPRLHLVTPTTAYRHVLSRDTGSPGFAPLQGLQVAMSLSDSPDLNGPEGWTRHHFVDLTVHIARTLISAGAAIAYGGDYRPMVTNNAAGQGYTLLLAELIRAYNQTAAHPAEFLHSYLTASSRIDEIPSSVPMTLHHLASLDDVAALAILPASEQAAHHPSLYLSDMRRVMARTTAARVLIGGAAEPRREPPGEGYTGRFPGVVEEAWRSLEIGQPLYVVGGFGGAAALVADLLEDREIPDRMKDATWVGVERVRTLAETVDHDPYRDKLGLPVSLEGLAQAIKAAGLPLLLSDQASMAWNGLTAAQNRELLRSRDTVRITSLILRGLLNLNSRAASGKLLVELVHGSVAGAHELDAIAVASFDDVPLGGAAAVIDRATGGRASAVRRSGSRLVSASRSGIDADWVYLASLGSVREAGAIEKQVADAARQTAAMARQYGLRRVGVVTYGGNVTEDARPAAREMLSALGALAGHASVTWFEHDVQRFEALRDLLAADPGVKLTTRIEEVSELAEPPRDEPLVVHVSHEDAQLVVTVLPPAGSTVVDFRRQALSEAELCGLAAGCGPGQRSTPDLPSLQARGQALARLILGDQAEQMLARTAGARVVIVHDVASSRLPFETIVAPGSGAPATGAGLSRRLAVPGVPVDRLFARPPRAQEFHVLLVIDPTENLPGADEEGRAVEALLRQLQVRVKLRVLRGGEATKLALREALPGADLLHYCGHAYFAGPGESGSGLVLAGGERLTLADLHGLELPRVAFVNACQAGRVRGEVTSEAASFAEFFLRAGAEAYLGTFWTVNDEAAQVFSAEVYTQLSVGKTLENAVTLARARLREQKLPDWANYLLYGEGRFRLVAERP